MTATDHVHRWSAMRFEIADGHPWVVETCADCGTTRRYRAFERFWDPGTRGRGAAPAGADRLSDYQKRRRGAACARGAW